MVSIDIIHLTTLFVCIGFSLCRWIESTSRYAHVFYPTKNPDMFPLQRLNVFMKIAENVPFINLLGSLYIVSIALLAMWVELLWIFNVAPVESRKILRQQQSKRNSTKKIVTQIILLQ